LRNKGKKDDKSCLSLQYLQFKDNERSIIFFTLYSKFVKKKKDDIETKSFFCNENVQMKKKIIRSTTTNLRIHETGNSTIA
jgi:hypothetical protein